MKIENIEVYGFRRALFAMRNPMESWNKSDSKFEESSPFYPPYLGEESVARQEAIWDISKVLAAEYPFIGPKDLELAKKLIKAGGDHRKFLRQIGIQLDITIPRCVWQELDTYKVSTVRNSCSTMHKLGSRDLEITDFQDEDISILTLTELNAMGYCYRNKLPYIDTTNGKIYAGVNLLHHLKLRLPEGFLQKATYTFNYEVAYRMYFSRKDHRMPEWSGSEGICEHLKKLPYFKEFIEEKD